MFPPSFPTFDGLSLHATIARLESASINARVIIVHGLGDHSGALPYRNLTRYLVAQNMAVYSFDLRGHGQSEGHRMFVNAWEDIQRDLGCFVELVQRETPNLPLFLIGLSMGGLIALNYVEQNPAGIQGIVAVAPAVGAPGIPPVLKLLMPIFSRLMPKMALNPGLDLTHISRDAVAARAYTSDPNFQTKTTPRLAAEVLRAIDQTRNQAHQLRLPLLILHGTEDTIVPPAGSAEFFEQAGSPDKERLSYPGAYHNLFIETNREEVFAEIAGWIRRHLSA